MEHAFLVYPIIEEDGTEQWICEFPELKGCIGVGDTFQEAVDEGMLNKAVWIEAAQEMGRTIPASKSLDSSEYSGRFNLRIPKSLHCNLALKAEQEGVSLNSLCTSILAEGLGERRAQTVYNLSISMPSPVPTEIENHWSDGKQKITKFPQTA
jgi:antitoxin HicB